MPYNAIKQFRITKQPFVWETRNGEQYLFVKDKNNNVIGIHKEEDALKILSTDVADGKKEYFLTYFFCDRRIAQLDRTTYYNYEKTIHKLGENLENDEYKYCNYSIGKEDNGVSGDEKVMEEYNLFEGVYNKAIVKAKTMDLEEDLTY